MTVSSVKNTKAIDIRLRPNAEQKPTCKRCLDGRWACGYGLQLTWPDEPRARKLKRPTPAPSQCPFGETRPRTVRQISSEKDVSTSASFVNITLADFDRSSHQGDTSNGDIQLEEFNEDEEIISCNPPSPPRRFHISSVLPPISSLPGCVDMSPLAKRLFSFCKLSYPMLNNTPPALMTG